MNTQPTVKQMKARSLSGHRQLLEAVRDGRKVDVISDGEWRGLRKCMATLRAWDCIDADGNLTERGRELLAAL